MGALPADQIASVDIYTGETPQAVVFAGASFGIHLEKAGAAVLRAYAENCLVSILGGDIRNAIEGMITTAWHSEPLTLGSYSYARPGGADARGVLQHPVDDRLYFAGEATSIAHYGTAHGAFLSGQDAGQRVVADITLP
jgi:monoamine oxidase